MEKGNNGMDKLLQNALSGAKSHLPEGMLQRILDDKKRKHRAIFWWLNFVVAIYCGAMAYWYFGVRPNGHGTGQGIAQMVGGQRKANKVGASQQFTGAEKMPQKSSSDQPEKQTNGENNIAFYHTASEGKNSGLTNDHEILRHEEAQKNISDDAENVKVVNHEPVQTHTNDAEKTAPKEENIPEKKTENRGEDQVPAAMNTQEKKDTVLDQNTSNKKIEGKKNKEKNHLGKLYFTLALGGQWESPKLHVPSQDPSYVHRDYASFLSSAFKPSVGANINVGVLTELKNFRLGVGVQYLHQSGELKYSYQVKDVPVIDTNKRIVGYLQLPNSQRFNIDSTFHYREQIFALPLIFGYNINLASNYSLLLGAGLTPQFRMVSGMQLPQKLYIQDFRQFNMRSVLTCPANISFGVTKKVGLMRLGIQSRYYIPGMDKTRIGDGMILRSNRFEFGLVLQMKLGGIKR